MWHGSRGNAGRDSANREPARPYRPRLVCKERAIRVTRSSACHPGPLCLSDALFAGRRSWRSGASSRLMAAQLRNGPKRDLERVSPPITICSGARRRDFGSTIHCKRFLVSVRFCLHETADEIYDQVAAHSLAQPEFRPRALFDRFNIDVIATTEGALDTLEHHDGNLRKSDWSGRVITTYRPDNARLISDHPQFSANSNALQRSPPAIPPRGKGIWTRIGSGARSFKNTAQLQPITAIARQERPTWLQVRQRRCSIQSSAARIRWNRRSFSGRKC